MEINKMEIKVSMKIITLLFLSLFVLLLGSSGTPAQNKNIYTCVTDFVSKEKPKRVGVRSAVSQPSKKWIPGQKIRVRFLNGNQFLQSKIRQYAEVWERFGNIDFVFVPSGAAEIRVSFRLDDGSWSFIGKDSLTKSYIKSGNGTRFVNDDSGASMNYGWLNENTSEEEFRRITLHEFGHALGLHHEHQNRNNNIQWNEEAVFAYFAEHGWSRERTQDQVLDKYGDNSEVTNGVYDRLSIMHYSYPAELIKGGAAIPSNTILSAGDKRIIAEMYPFDETNSVIKPSPNKPKPPVVDQNQTKILFSNIDVDFDGYNEKSDEYGMEFSTFFNVTNGLKKDLTIVIYFFNADGKPLMDTNKKYYAVGGQVAAYRRFKPDYTNAVYKDFRIFIPYEELEGIECGDNNLKYTIGIWNGNTRVISVGATYFTLSIECED
jgi:hypothetical protein